MHRHRSGYTGEDGFEISCPAEEAPSWHDAACRAGGGAGRAGGARYAAP
ncbi:MAG: hypothetical protein U1E43_01650 [Rhodospirillales bacterium]